MDRVDSFLLNFCLLYVLYFLQPHEPDIVLGEYPDVSPATPAAAQEGQEPIEGTVNAAEEELSLQPQSDEKPAEILFEDVAKREWNAKHYRMSDGTYQAVIYNEPIHYFDASEGKFRGIDNTLVLQSADTEDADDFEGYQNRYGEVKVKLSRNVNDRNLFSVQKGGHKVVWKLLGKGRKARENKEDTDFGGLNPTEAQIAAPVTAYTEGSEKNKRFAYRDKLSSEVRYNEFTPGADLQYIVSGERIKENIIIKERAESYAFAFQLKAKNLDIALADDGESVEFFVTKLDDEGNQNKEVIFTLPAAYMYDAQDKTSTAVAYDIEEQNDGKYLFKILPDADWMNAEERVFPVTIDPLLIFNQSNRLAIMRAIR